MAAENERLDLISANGPDRIARAKLAHERAQVRLKALNVALAPPGAALHFQKQPKGITKPQRLHTW